MIVLMNLGGEDGGRPGTDRLSAGQELLVRQIEIFPMAFRPMLYDRGVSALGPGPRMRRDQRTAMKDLNGSLGQADIHGAAGMNMRNRVVVRLHLHVVVHMDFRLPPGREGVRTVSERASERTSESAEI